VAESSLKVKAGFVFIVNIQIQTFFFTKNNLCDYKSIISFCKKRPTTSLLPHLKIVIYKRKIIVLKIRKTCVLSFFNQELKIVGIFLQSLIIAYLYKFHYKIKLT